MAVQGKKINELTAIGTVSDETVLPAVYVSGTTVNSTANKISIEQISTKVQDDMSTQLAGKQDTLVSGTNIKTINGTSVLGSGDLEIGLPNQTGQSGKFLTTDGAEASWANVDALPSQTGQSGKFLTTDGTNASWEEVSISENTLVTEGLVPSSEFSVVSTTVPTAPMNGWYNIVATSSNTSSYITSEITATNSNYQVVAGYPSGSKMSLIIPAEKGRSFNFSSGNVYNVSIKFIPAEASERSMVPSNVSLSVPVQESGATYIAQETGYMNFTGNSANTSSYIISEATTDNPLEQSITNHPSGYTINLIIPVVKGRTYKISYSQINNIQCKLIVGQEVKVYGGGGGVDTSLSNLTDAGKTQVAHLAMPSVAYDDLTPPSSGGADRTRYTAPADGYFVINYDVSGGGVGTSIINESKGEIGTYQINSTRAGFYTGWCPATKGDIIGVWLTVWLPTVNWLRFYYAEGSKHEKQGA